MKAPSKLPTLRKPRTWPRTVAVYATAFALWLALACAAISLAYVSTTPEAKSEPLPAHYPTKGKGK